jgi:peptidoglycan hydrolase CwlO-like protein
MAKEKKLPSVIGVQPASPALDAANFSVVQIDAHIQDSQNISTLNNTIKEKAEAEKEIQELNKKIDGIKATITTVSKTPQEAKRLQKQLAEVQKEREDKTTTLSTLVTNLTLQISTTPQFVTRS